MDDDVKEGAVGRTAVSRSGEVVEGSSGDTSAMPIPERWVQRCWEAQHDPGQWGGSARSVAKNTLGLLAGGSVGDDSSSCASAVGPARTGQAGPDVPKRIPRRPDNQLHLHQQS